MKYIVILFTINLGRIYLSKNELITDLFYYYFQDILINRYYE